MTGATDMDPIVENPKENLIRLLKHSRDEAAQMIAEGVDPYAKKTVGTACRSDG